MSNEVTGLRFRSRIGLPMILQTEASECGLTCLAMVSAFHGYQTDLASLRSRFQISLKGATLNHLLQIATNLNFHSRSLRVDLSELDQLSLPAVLHWDFNHFVVLKSVTRSKIVVHDPASGVKVLDLKEVSRHFTGVALELAPTQKFEQKIVRNRVRLLQLINGVPAIRRNFVQILLLAVVLQLFSIVSPFFIQLVVDGAIFSEDYDLLTVLGVGFLLLALIQVAVTAVRSWVLMVLGTSMNLHLQSNLFSHLLSLPLPFFEKRHLGDVVSRFGSIDSIQRTLTSGFIEAIVDGFMALLTLIVMFVYSWKLGVIVSSAALLYGLIRLVLYKPLRRGTEEKITHEANQQSKFLETVRGIQGIKLYNHETQRKSVYANLMVQNFNAGIRVQKLEILYRAMNGMLFGIENIAVIWVGGILVLNGGFSIGMLFAFMAYKRQFISRVTGLIEKAVEFRMLSLHLQRISDIALAEPEFRDDISSIAIQSLRPRIELHNVSFAYTESDPLVIDRLSLTIEEGESVAIVGSSGCGKTTLIKLMLGLLQPSEGEILVGGSSLSRIGYRNYRDMVGAVMQDDQLLSGSISDNISMFASNLNKERLINCSQLAAVHEDIIAMPMGYNTLIGDMGTVLSGGQKQRILLARALYKQPKILVLDEATSHLDIANERKVNEAVAKLRLTRVIIAHRPQTIASVDRVITLESAEASQLCA
ncbi:MAG: peptidase domain-containing ABC transporter [Methylococcales bacterium]